MDKLIRFINEYRHTNNCGPFETCRIEPATEWNSSYLVLSRDDNGEGDWKDWNLEVPRLISKEYGFIKRLVENDKINTESGPLYGFHFIMHNRQPYSLYETILMILAISDTPIEDLISYLR